MTSEQSTIFETSWPRTCIFANACWKEDAISAWLLTFACQRQAVAESRAKFESD
jgi:hypothetical protein